MACLTRWRVVCQIGKGLQSPEGLRIGADGSGNNLCEGTATTTRQNALMIGSRSHESSTATRPSALSRITVAGAGRPVSKR